MCIRDSKKGTDQYDRDRLKDGILAKAGIKMVRFMTNGSSEKERLVAVLGGGIN